MKKTKLSPFKLFGQYHKLYIPVSKSLNQYGDCIMRDHHIDVKYGVVTDKEYVKYVMETGGDKSDLGKHVVWERYGLDKTFAGEIARRYIYVPREFGDYLSYEYCDHYYLDEYGSSGALSLSKKHSIFFDVFPIKLRWWEDVDLDILEESCKEVKETSQYLAQKNEEQEWLEGDLLTWDDVDHYEKCINDMRYKDILIPCFRSDCHSEEKWQKALEMMEHYFDNTITLAGHGKQFWGK